MATRKKTLDFCMVAQYRAAIIYSLDFADRPFTAAQLIEEVKLTRSPHVPIFCHNCFKKLLYFKLSKNY